MFCYFPRHFSRSVLGSVAAQHGSHLYLWMRLQLGTTRKPVSTSSTSVLKSLSPSYMFLYASTAVSTFPTPPRVLELTLGMWSARNQRNGQGTIIPSTILLITGRVVVCTATHCPVERNPCSRSTRVGNTGFLKIPRHSIPFRCRQPMVRTDCYVIEPV